MPSPSAQPPVPPAPADVGAGRVAAGNAGVVGRAADRVLDAAMARALDLARSAGEAGEVPVGAVVLSPQGAVLAEAANARQAEHDLSLIHI